MKNYALITGAASGFGHQFAKLLAKDGFQLALVDIDEEGLLDIKAELHRNYGIHVLLLNIDLAVQGSVEKINKVIDNLAIDVLINNAGQGVYGMFSGTSWNVEQKMIEVHVHALTHLTKLILPRMLRRRWGRIMNVSSVAAFQPGPLMAVYYASKAYILLFTEALANELKGTGVTATAFCPGQTATNFQKTVAENSNSMVSKTNWIMAKLDPVAKRGYDAMMTGKTLLIPGALNKAIVQANRILPRKFAAGLVRQFQERIRT